MAYQTLHPRAACPQGSPAMTFSFPFRYSAARLIPQITDFEWNFTRVGHCQPCDVFSLACVPHRKCIQLILKASRTDTFKEKACCMLHWGILLSKGDARWNVQRNKIFSLYEGLNYTYSCHWRKIRWWKTTDFENRTRSLACVFFCFNTSWIFSSPKH